MITLDWRETMSIKITAVIIALFTMMILCSVVNADTMSAKFFDKDRIKGSGTLISDYRDVNEFNKIRISGSADLYITVGEKQSIKVTFDDNIIEYIQTDVKGKTLQIDCDVSYSSRKDCRIDITIPELKGIILSGSGDVHIENLRGDFFEYTLKGSGDMDAQGEIEELELNLYGSGDINTRELKAQNAVAVIKGSGDIDLYADNTLDCSVYGSGDIEYYGNPKDVTRHVAGSGSIKKR